MFSQALIKLHNWYCKADPLFWIMYKWSANINMTVSWYFKTQISPAVPIILLGRQPNNNLLLDLESDYDILAPLLNTPINRHLLRDLMTIFNSYFLALHIGLVQHNSVVLHCRGPEVHVGVSQVPTLCHARMAFLFLIKAPRRGLISKL